MTTLTPLARHARRALVLTVIPVAALVTAGPAAAVPEGWSEPDPVNGLAALTVFVFGPLAVAAVTVFLVLAPRWVSAARAAPAITATETTGPTTRLDELLAPDRPEELEAAERSGD